MKNWVFSGRRSSCVVVFVLSTIVLMACPGRSDEPTGCVRVPGCEASSEICCDAERICEERVCQGVGYICSVDAAGDYLWVDRAASCDDADSCTVDDLCVGGRCQGLPMVCDSPPPTVCVDGNALKVFAAAGKCVGGICEYSSKTSSCGGSCEEARCVDDPCKGIICDQPPSSCYDVPGTCVQGKCQYKQHAVGATCKVADACVLHAKCDAKGKCAGDLKDCKVAHASGASCVPGTGICQGYTCDKGYRDCNTDMPKDGCETEVLSNVSHCGNCTTVCKAGAHQHVVCAAGKCKTSCDKNWGDCDGVASNGCERDLLSSVSHCGNCTTVCKAGAHQQVVCTAGKCKTSCDSTWGDCDGAASNGCEQRLGVASCSYAGTDTLNGCGAAYCGKGTATTDMEVVNFGTWYCAFCSHCRRKPDGSGSWCLRHYSGIYAPATCLDCCQDPSTDPSCGP